MGAPEAAPRPGEPESRPEPAAERFHWSAWPAKERPAHAAVLIACVAVLGVVVRQATLFVLLSVSSWLLPTRYRLTDEGLEVKSLGVTRARPWSEMRRMAVDEAGIFLSPFERPHWLEAYRGVRLLTGGNRDQVVAFVEERLAGSRAAG
jgi:hypothetical protein